MSLPAEPALERDGLRELRSAAEATVVRTSSRTGDGIDQLTAHVRKLASEVERRTDLGPAFLPLDQDDPNAVAEAMQEAMDAANSIA